MLFRKITRPCKRWPRNRINRVWSDSQLYAGRELIFSPKQSPCFIPEMRCLLLVAKIEKDGGNCCTHSHFLSGFRSLKRMPVHVVEECRPCFNHLKNGKLCSPIHILCSKLSLKRPNLVVQPCMQGHVISIPPEQAHCRMGVAVEKRWNRSLSSAVYHHAALIRHLADG